MRQVAHELAEAATASSVRERAAMDVEREVVDLYRALLMKDHIGDVFEGTATGITGGGVYVSLDEPFVDVLVRFESMGPDQYEIDDDEIGVFGRRSGDKINLGDRMTVTIEDVLLTRRMVFARRVVPEKVLAHAPAEAEPRFSRGDRGRRSGKEAGQSARGGRDGASLRKSLVADASRGGKKGTRESPARDQGGGRVPKSQPGPRGRSKKRRG